MAIATFTTPPDIITNYNGWKAWEYDRIQAFEAYCPSARTATYYISNTGNDSNPGTIDLPWLTRAKAITHETTSGGNVRYRFKRGDVWNESGTWVPVNNNVTIDDYGDTTLAMPLWNAFTQKYLDASNVWTLASGTRYTVAEVNDIAWVRLVTDRLGETLGTALIRAADAAGCEATTNSFFWTASTLHINLGATNPNTVDIEAVISNTNNGVAFNTDGCRIENIRADGYGCHRTTTASQAQPFTNTATGTKANFFKGCEGYFSGSHVLAHYIAGGTGGCSMWLNCKGGFCKYNAGGDNIFNSYTSAGTGTETWFINCTAKYGTLKSSDWAYATEKARGSAFLCHTTTNTHALIVVDNLRCVTSHTPLSYFGSFSNIPTVTVRSDVRAFRVNCTFEKPSVATKQFPSSFFSSNSITYGERYGVFFQTNAPGALSTDLVNNHWYVNSYIEIDPSAASDFWGIINQVVGTNSIHFWHTMIRTTGTNASGFGIDYGIHFGAVPIGTGREKDCSMVNSVVSWGNGATSASYLALTNVAFDGTKGINKNGYYLIDAGVGNERGFETDAGAIVLGSEPTLTTRISSLLATGNVTIPKFSHDINGKARTITPPDIGPVDFSSPDTASLSGGAGSALSLSFKI